MDSSAIVAMVLINLIVMGGFILFLRIAIKKEKEKLKE